MQAAGYCVFHLNSQTPLTTSVGSSGPVIVGLSPFGATKKIWHGVSSTPAVYPNIQQGKQTTG